MLPMSLNTDPKNDVLTPGMASFASQAVHSVDFGQLFAGAVMTIVPVFIVHLVFQR